MTAGSIYAGAQITADDIQGVAPLAVVKQNDTASVVNSTALSADPELRLNLDANSAYRFFFTPMYTAVAGADMTIQFTFPSGATATYLQVRNGTGGVLVLAATTSGNAGRYYGNGSLAQGAIITGTILTASAGTFQVLSGQATANATAAVMLKGSELDCWKVG